MGKLDIETKTYFQNREHFADLFNFKLYGGRQLIHAADLKPFDSAEVVVAYGNLAKQQRQVFRDNVSIWAAMQDDHSAYIILGIESQANVNYAGNLRRLENITKSFLTLSKVRIKAFKKDLTIYSRFLR